MEFRDLEPQELQDIDLPEIEVHRVEPLDRPHPDQVEARSYDTVEVRSLELVEALEVERLDIRQFDFPDPAELRPQDLKDFGRPYVEGPDIMTIEASELKPAVRFEDLFFQPREYLQAETYDPVEFETVSPEPYRGQKAQYLDVADPDTYNNEARGPELHPQGGPGLSGPAPGGPQVLPRLHVPLPLPLPGRACRRRPGPPRQERLPGLTGPWADIIKSPLPHGGGGPFVVHLT